MPTILVVEDNEDNRDVLSRRLERRGFSVITATDGLQGYSLARSEKPDLILMDISLPEMNGWEVIGLLKAADATNRIPIIVLTAHGLVSDRARAMEAGCDGYQNKPVDFQRLSDCIDHLLAARRPT